MRKNLTALAAGLLLCAPLIAAADDPQAPKRYSIKQDRPDAGSHILRETVNSDLPPDKPYGELTAEQQRAVKSQYEKMGPDDEPPYPLKGPQGLYKAMVVGQNKRLARGTLSLVVNVDSRGEAESVAVLSSPDPDLTQFAARLLIQAKYKPARCNGAPCAMQYPFRINLDVRE